MKFLVIQTAFIGDVVLATGIVEKLHRFFPDAQIDFLVRKGNEGLLQNHPYLHKVLIWDKKNGKLKNLWKLLRGIRKRRYDKVINVQRFAATGILTAFSGAREKIGFDKNPLSWLFDKKIKHVISDVNHPIHEVDRNNELIREFTNDEVVNPHLYPSAEDTAVVQQYRKPPYITISPASVWFTKQFPKDKWISFAAAIPANYTIYLLGAPGDTALGEEIRTAGIPATVVNLCGKLSFLQSAALMKEAAMNYVNDSAPMHFASSVNAPVTAVYCSTLPSFGFGPLSDKRFIVEVQEPLTCRPCGLHGRPACPLGHFKCAYGITNAQLLNSL
ncbi:heptosyltransferase [Niastella koreensis]|uniref:Glycosyl transferase family 9 n=2 Tax=Niastella koreensis TaxID=354356 RepID=G8TED2_NIAKG|nr:glycosyltransferase family 9 protein [Niastella koreensis]AEV98342.1 glycosyl transferase family 9 [Niastella koreensis GR20-10]OQP53203.1 heptosyltransferase [Niastella koreensis]